MCVQTAELEDTKWCNARYGTGTSDLATLHVPRWPVCVCVCECVSLAAPTPLPPLNHRHHY